MQVTADTIKAAIFCLFIGGGFFISAIRCHRRARKIADTPRSKAESAPQGYVEFEGFAWPAGKTFQSRPETESVYYSFLLQKQVSEGSGKNRRKKWVDVYRYFHSEPFYLVDATGLVLVNPRDGELNLEGGRTRIWSRLNQKEKNHILTNVIKEPVSGFPPSNFLFGIFSSKYRVIETDLFVGSPLHASGDFRTSNEDLVKIQSPGLSDFSQKVFNKEGRSIKNLGGQFDYNRNGKVSAEESKQGYSVVAQVSRKKSSLNKVQENEYQIFGRLGSSTEHRLFLADAFEEFIKERLTRFLWLKFGGGAALMTLGIALTVGLDLSFLFEKKSPARFSKPPPSVQTEAKPVREISSIGYDKVLDLHARCIGGGLSSCETLVQKKSELNLSNEHITYYEGQACNLGKKEFCK